MDPSRQNAMVEFIGTFAPVSSPPEDIQGLSDGVALFEALSEIAPDYFDPTTIARHLGDNWALKSSNLRKLLRNLENYYHYGLNKDADFSTVNMADIARESNVTSIGNLVELIAAAAVTCPDKAVYVSRIMEMSPDAQTELKDILQSGLRRLSDYEADYDEGDENELVFGNDDYDNDGGKGMNEDEDDDNMLFQRNHLKYGENDENFEEELLDLRNELASVKSQAAVADEENDKIQNKLRAIVSDLQDRLSLRQDELSQYESDLKRSEKELEDTRSKLQEVIELKTQMADDLDVANAKAQQLHRAEATVVAYKKKLDSVGVMNQQMTDLEGQAASYLQQIMELEAEVKKSASLQKSVTELEDKVSKMESERTDMETSARHAATEIIDLKNRINAAENARKMYEDELTELRSKQRAVADTAADDAASNTPGLVVEHQPSIEHRERLMRAEIENKKLKEQVEHLTTDMANVTAKNIDLQQVSTETKKALAEAKAATEAAEKVAATATAAAAAAASVPPPQVEPAIPESTLAELEAAKALVKELKMKNQTLNDTLTVKEKENTKISSDKDKLEAYTKRTLAKFQDKYLVALQECKTKLKEKQDKIDALESRSSSERNAQKREERLLSSSIYELGLAIMQHRLKTSTGTGGTATPGGGVSTPSGGP